MKFSAQAMVNGWIDASLGRDARIGDGNATIDAVRGDARSPVVTIVNWRVQSTPVGRFKVQHETARVDTRDTIGHDLARPTRRRVAGSGLDAGPARQGPATR